MNYLKRILCVLGHEDYDYEAKLLTWAGELLTWAAKLLTWAGELLTWTAKLLTRAGELLYDKLRHEKYAKTFNYVYQKIYFG